jgi:hypothetical protein
MVFDGAECPHFGDCLKRTLGGSLCMSKDEANQRSDDERGVSPARTGCSWSKLQVFLRSELLVVAVAKVIRDGDVKK